MITVKDVMTSVVTSATMDCSLDEIEQMMSVRNLQCLPIVDSARNCIGVISSVDILRCHSLRHKLEETQAWEICTQPATMVRPDLALSEAIELMVSNNIHHLIVSVNDEVIGIMSSMDVLAQFVWQRSAQSG